MNTRSPDYLYTLALLERIGKAYKEECAKEQARGRAPAPAQASGEEEEPW